MSRARPAFRVPVIRLAVRLATEKVEGVVAIDVAATRSRSTPRTERLPFLKLGKYLRFEARTVRAFLEKKCRPR